MSNYIISLAYGLRRCLVENNSHILQSLTAGRSDSV